MITSRSDAINNQPAKHIKSSHEQQRNRLYAHTDTHTSAVIVGFSNIYNMECWATLYDSCSISSFMSFSWRRQWQTIYVARVQPRGEQQHAHYDSANALQWADLCTEPKTHHVLNLLDMSLHRLELLCRRGLVAIRRAGGIEGHEVRRDLDHGSTRPLEDG